MKNGTIRDKYWLVPASALVLLMGCAVPAAPADDADLDIDSDTSEEVDEALLAWENGEDEEGAMDWQEIPDMDVNVQSAPSLAVVGGRPHMAFVGGDNRCLMSSYGDSGWQSPMTIPGCVGPAAPTLGVTNDILNVGYVGQGGNCMLNAYDGYSWANPVGISGCGGAFAPVVSPYGGSLNVVYGGLRGGLYHTTCGGALGVLGGGCGTGVLIRGVSTVLPPALLGWDGGLTLAYTGLNRQLYYSTYGLGGWGGPIGIPGAFASYGPSLSYFGGSPFLGYPSLYGGYGFHPFLGRGLGWGGFHHLRSPFFGGPFALGPFGFGRGLGLGGFFPHRGRMFFGGIRGFGRGLGFGHHGFGRRGGWGW